MNAGPVLLSQLDSANFRSFQVSKFVWKNSNLGIFFQKTTFFLLSKIHKCI
jgi:hypothetical protein